jgi:hypothetical protein
MFDIRAPTMNIPPVDLTGTSRSDAYTTFVQHGQTPSTSPSRSHTGLESIVSSHKHHPVSSTYSTQTMIDETPQHPSVSSGFGSEVLDGLTTQGYSLSTSSSQAATNSMSIDRVPLDDWSCSITLSDELRTKFNSNHEHLRTCLTNEIARSIDQFDGRKDRQILDKILHHAVDMINHRQVRTYKELQQKLIVEHKNHAYLVDPIVRSVYYTIEKHARDKIDPSNSSLTIHDVCTMMDDSRLLLHCTPSLVLHCHCFSRWLVFRTNRHATQ